MVRRHLGFVAARSCRSFLDFRSSGMDEWGGPSNGQLVGVAEVGLAIVPLVAVAPPDAAVNRKRGRPCGTFGGTAVRQALRELREQEEQRVRDEVSEAPRPRQVELPRQAPLGALALAVGATPAIVPWLQQLPGFWGLIKFSDGIKDGSDLLLG